MTNLDGALGKLVRAYQHLFDLEASIDRFIEGDDAYGVTYKSNFVRVEWVDCSVEEIAEYAIPSNMVRRRKSDGNLIVPVSVEAEVEVIVHQCRLPPVADWSILVGDIVHNLRSALDQAVFALSCFYPKPVGKLPPEYLNYHWRRIQFPITGTELGWLDPRNGHTALLWAIDPSLVAEFEALQPWAIGKKFDLLPETTVLAILQELWNRDKHRQLNFVNTSLGLSSSRAYLPDQSAEFHTEIVQSDVFGPVKDGAPIGVLLFKAVNPTARLFAMDVQMHARLRFDVAFEQGPPGHSLPVRDYLNDACDVVAGILVWCESKLT